MRVHCFVLRVLFTHCVLFVFFFLPTGGGTVQQPVIGRGRVLVEQPASANANRRGPPVLQRHVLANGQPPPDPDSIPVLEPITAEEHFHAEMLHQTIRVGVTIVEQNKRGSLRLTHVIRYSLGLTQTLSHWCRTQPVDSNRCS